MQFFVICGRIWGILGVLATLEQKQGKTLVFTPKNGQNRQNLTKNGVFGLTLYQMGFGSKGGLLPKQFLAVLNVLFRKKPLLTIVGPFKMPF